MSAVKSRSGRGTRFSVACSHRGVCGSSAQGTAKSAEKRVLNLWKQVFIEIFVSFLFFLRIYVTI